MEAAQDTLRDRLEHVRAVVLLAFQVAIPVVGVVYLFVRGADFYIVSLMLATMYSLTPTPLDRPTVPAAVVTRLAGAKTEADRDRKAS